MADKQADERSKLLPNTTQTPNLYLDHCMAYLTGDEFKVLMYTTRRTLGFGKTADRISLSQYADGITAADGRILDMGTGLNRGTISKVLKDLIKFGLIIQADESQGNDGAAYSMQMDDQKINWDKMVERLRKTSAANIRRVETARLRLAEKHSVLSDRTQDERSVAQDGSVLSDRTVAFCGTDTQNIVETKGNLDLASQVSDAANPDPANPDIQSHPDPQQPLPSLVNALEKTTAVPTAPVAFKPGDKVNYPYRTGYLLGETRFAAGIVVKVAKVKAEIAVLDTTGPEPTPQFKQVALASLTPRTGDCVREALIEAAYLDRSKPKEPRRATELKPLTRAIGNCLLGQPDDDAIRANMAYVNKLQRLLLTCEYYADRQMPTDAESQALADGLCLKFIPWYKATQRAEYRIENATAPSGCDTLPKWYGRWIGAGRPSAPGERQTKLVKAPDGYGWIEVDA